MSKTTVNKYLKLGNNEALEKLFLVKKDSQFNVAIDLILKKLDDFPKIRANKAYRRVIE